MAELLAVLFFHPAGMHFHPKDPQNASNDKFVLSKGHAAPIYYAAWALAGNFPKEDLLNLRKITSDLEGHPTPRLSFTDFATGSLGQGLGFTVGSAYVSKHMDNNPNRYFCLLGDGETAEGSVWEAAFFASYYKLDNLVVIVDVNRLGQSDPTHLQHEVENYHARFESFGFRTVTIDGHDVSQITNALSEARQNRGKPFCIVAKTFKGKHCGKSIEDLHGFHGKPLNSAEALKYVEGLITNKDIQVKVTPPEQTGSLPSKDQKFSIKLDYDKDKKYSTRQGFGFALKKLADGDKEGVVIGLDADVKNSTMSETLAKTFPERFINCFIAEQNMVSVALGASKRNKIPFVATFATFFTRAFDQIRMSAISFGNIKYFGSHTGVHIGPDGPSQMGLEDLSLFRSIPNLTVLATSDVVSTERAVELAANTYGAFYIRGGRNTHKILYAMDEKFEVGKAKVLRSGQNDRLTIVSSGATLHEALGAADLLAKEGISVRVIDLFSVKPVDRETLEKNGLESNSLMLVVEDHYYEGGIGDAVKSSLGTSGIRIHHQAVGDIPRSGEPDELYEMFGLSSSKIAERVRGILKN